MRTLLLHPILPPRLLSTSWTSIWKLADKKAFLPAVCCSFKPTLILCPPAENWLLEEAGSPWEELAKVSVQELVPSCLFPCLSQISVEEGKPFPLPLTWLSFLLPQRWQSWWRECKWSGLYFETFLELLHLPSSAGPLFVCVLKFYPWHCFQTWNTLQFSWEPFKLLDSLFPARLSSFSECTLIAWVPSELC